MIKPTSGAKVFPCIAFSKSAQNPAPCTGPGTETRDKWRLFPEQGQNHQSPIFQSSIEVPERK
jgi:hypothetical protein